MTLENMATDVFEALAEPTDLEFRDSAGTVDTASRGWKALVRSFERGLIATARWKNPRTGRRFRWPGSTIVSSVKAGTTIDETVAGGSSVSAIVLSTTTYSEGYFTGWIAEIDGSTRRVAHSSPGTIELATALSTVPTTGTAIVLRRPFVALSSGAGVLRVTDSSTGNDLTLVRPEEVRLEPEPTLGDPTFFYQGDERVYVDPVPEERWLYVERENYPSLSGLAGEEPSLPEPLHYAIVLWAMAWGFGRMLNPEMKASYRREYQDYMFTVQLPEDNLLDRQDDSFDLRTE